MEMQNQIQQRLQEIADAITASSSQRMNTMLAPEFCSCDSEKGQAVFRFRKLEWEKNQRGEVHGGAVSAMFDTAMGMSVLGFTGCKQTATADLAVSFIRPFTAEAFLFTVELLHPGRSLLRLRAVATDEESGKTLASATANFVCQR